MIKKSVKRSTRQDQVPRRRINETHELECRECGAIAVKPVQTTAYTCWECVSSMLEDSLLPAAKRPTGYPRGWKFMGEFVHVNGTVYHKGIEQPNLKGTLKPTEIKERPKDTRSKAQKAADKQDTLVEISKLKKAIKKESRVTYRRKLETQLKQLQKKL